MSRSGYTDDDNDDGYFAMWRGQVASAIRGKRGQALLREMITALDAMPDKRLIASELIKDGEVCALGCIGRSRGLEMQDMDPDDHDQLGAVFNVAPQLIAEIEFINDESWGAATPEARWMKMRKWAQSHLKATPPSERTP